MQPERRELDFATFIDAIRRRRAVVDAIEWLALGAATTAVMFWMCSAVLPLPSAMFVATAICLIVAAFGFSRKKGEHTSGAAARAAEGVRPGRNVVVTAEELCRHPDRASAWMRARVVEEALHVMKGLRPADVVPAKRAGLAALGAVVLCVAVWFAPDIRDASGAVTHVARSATDAVLGRQTARLTVTIQPPAYSRVAQQRVTDPERLEVLEGTRLQFTLSGSTPARLRLGATAMGTLTPGAEGIVVRARDSGYFAVEEEATKTPARLIALSVIRDRAPSVTIEQPARDLLLPDGTRAIPIRISAADDLGLSSLELRYTKVSGSGEQFEFGEGRLPVQLRRDSGREWRAETQMALATLKLGAGDSLVYRAVARDQRPGDAGLGASDTFFIEIAGPGQVPLEGVEMPPEEERYALSQQMIVLKIERLRGRERTMTREAVAEETAMLAAEQRSVRANFIFLLGGHVEDEFEEAEHSSEIAEGRLQNTARRDINAAISEMTRAEQGLVAVNTSVALPPARAAVEALQRAFGRSRYLLRSLTSRSRLDPSRRLTGNLSAADAWRRAVTETEPREGEAARALLARLLAAYGSLSRGQAPANALEGLAERALSIDPGSSRWQEIAGRIQTAQRGSLDAQKVLDEVIRQVATDAGRALVPPAHVTVPRSALERAWQRGGSR